MAMRRATRRYKRESRSHDVRVLPTGELEVDVVTATLGRAPPKQRHIVPNSTECERLSELLGVDVVRLSAGQAYATVCPGSSHETRGCEWFDLSPLTGTSVGARAGSLPLTGSTVEMACLKTSCTPGPDSSRTANWSK